MTQNQESDRAFSRIPMSIHSHRREDDHQPNLAPGWHIWYASRNHRTAILTEQWDRMLLGLGGDITQSVAWVDYALSATYRMVLLLQGVDSTGNVAAMAVGYVLAPRWPFAAFRGLRFVAFPSTGLADDALADAILACERIAAQEGYMHIEFLGFLGTKHSSSLLKTLCIGYQMRERIEYVVDLALGSDVLWSNMRKDQRRNVRVSTDRNVTVLRTEAREAVQALRELQLEASRRHETRGQGFGVPTQEKYDALFASLSRAGTARLYCAYLDGAVVMAALCTTFGQLARGVYNGASQKGLEARATTAVIWHIMKELSQEGLSCLSFGMADREAEDPSSPAHGLHEFKLGLGARTRPVIIACKELRPALVRAHRTLRSIRSTFRPRS